MMKILDKINNPDDIKKLSEKELITLAEETRKFIIDNVDKTGGHLAPSLGVVELTIALLKVYNLPNDKIVWDVGHQAYAYKIYTGRRDVFHTNRQYKGISGFIKPSESEYDSFGVGHASTSISAGFGFVMAKEIKKEDFNVISVIGDGSITGGLAFEGLNNAGVSGKNFLVILNDNAMSISKNVGAISKYTTSVLSDPTFNKLKNDIWNFTGKY
ncbi:MAG: 1-deoxy-D-xylulose-5-phosphate synthase, partial [Candidatus Delongbacteria bacterium]|nr:1-deoxy-D-xylulose-5-phosphate synthase [Candidatus Delongbacteria bacterium]MCG2760877.1 1-deoxy-D-xylulose-5-phosphate synthase [Candidatus Delongbacteria bacterium]